MTPLALLIGSTGTFLSTVPVGGGGGGDDEGGGASPPSDSVGRVDNQRDLALVDLTLLTVVTGKDFTKDLLVLAAIILRRMVVVASIMVD